MARLVRNVVILCFGVVIFFVALTVIDRRFFVGERNEKRISDLATIRQAISSYLTYNQSFPRIDEINFGREWRTPDAVYMEKVPQESKVFTKSPYCYNNFGNIYLLCAQMEGSGYSCQSSEKDWSCNACVLNNGKSVNYNYCVYGSF